ncbi:MAG: hypothetical protein NUV49_03585 [Patescibacteria group bacterium]|nr:hypothetical protein [Patescibacteria group bacterium]
MDTPQNEAEPIRHVGGNPFLQMEKSAEKFWSKHSELLKAANTKKKKKAVFTPK